MTPSHESTKPVTTGGAVQSAADAGHTGGMKAFVVRVASPSQWTVRTRTTVAATVVVTLCLLLAGGALLLVLFSSLETSARVDGRLANRSAGRRVADASRPPTSTGRCWPPIARWAWCRSSIETGKIVVASAGSPAAPVSDRRDSAGYDRVPRTDSAQSDRTTSGSPQLARETPAGPVTVLVGADREPVENVVTTVAGLLAIGGPIVVALVAFGTYRLVGAALQPVERIRLAGVVDDQRQARRADSGAAGRRRGRATGGDDERHAGPARGRPGRPAAVRQRRVPRVAKPAGDDHRGARTRPSPSRPARPVAHRRVAAARGASDASLVEDLLLLARADEHTGRHVAVDVDLDDIVLCRGRSRSRDHSA